jgi:hypothetical protein
LVASVILFCVFLLSGGLDDLKSYIFGASSIAEYRFATIAPFFGGFVLIGFFGLLYIYRNARSWKCLLGFLIVGFCYFAIETLFQAVTT